MLPVHLALVSLTPGVALNDVLKVSAAIQKQLVRDARPLWGIDATIDGFGSLDDVPLGYWTILVVDTFSQGGQHKRRHDLPFALVAAATDWSLFASHEAVEMLVDPFGDRRVPGQSPIVAQGRVEFLVEVCDPCQARQNGYTVNGILVSDFYTPAYFDPVAAPGVRYSYTGAIKQPREVLAGGYLTWRDPASEHWFQSRRFGGNATTVDLGPIDPGAFSFRAVVDELTPAGREEAEKAASDDVINQQRALRETAEGGAQIQARRLLDFLAAERMVQSNHSPGSGRRVGRSSPARRRHRPGRPA